MCYPSNEVLLSGFSSYEEIFGRLSQAELSVLKYVLDSAARNAVRHLYQDRFSWSMEEFEELSILCGVSYAYGNFMDDAVV